MNCRRPAKPTAGKLVHECGGPGSLRRIKPANGEVNFVVAGVGACPTRQSVGASRRLAHKNNGPRKERKDRREPIERWARRGEVNPPQAGELQPTRRNRRREACLYPVVRDYIPACGTGGSPTSELFRRAGSYPANWRATLRRGHSARPSKSSDIVYFFRVVWPEEAVA